MTDLWPVFVIVVLALLAFVVWRAWHIPEDGEP